ncbi:Hypothetical Protein FCC1311_002922 [Hondaea fermentalgiana]|uniref:HD domain-containing protein n=1 Tax=Hondaea fermentalgiana TaxID=2315210 RepID=A0A2R5G8T5_9STRA|nr:Hypothetical Protein FCC1311_002922 [Hondaea fermentalgiana]|eukprot:GBG24074.1 Hypothetical Protein FCC1311_002922 [Hondaea fermentalgiana]
MENGAGFANLRADVEAFVRKEMEGYDPSHGALALDLAKRENVEDLEVVELAALLHDVKDHKYAAEGEDAGSAIHSLLDGRMDAPRVERIVSTVENVSFSKQMKRKEPLEMTPELAVVQDADRLDAIGAIGIARCFAFGGSRDRALYTVRDGRVRIDGEKDDASSLGHFYEKLLRIKDFLNTPSGKAEGAARHAMLEAFTSQLVKESGLEAEPKQ